MENVRRIIVEGADQQGKSEVCKKLASVLGWNIQHFGVPPIGFNFHSDYLINTNTISDRNFLSEMVYSHFRDYRSRVKQPFDLIQKMKAKNYLLILVDRGDSFVFDHRRFEEFELHEILAARKLYDAIFDTLDLKKIRLDPKNVDDLIIVT